MFSILSRLPSALASSREIVNQMRLVSMVEKDLDISEEERQAQINVNLARANLARAKGQLKKIKEKSCTK